MKQKFLILILIISLLIISCQKKKLKFGLELDNPSDIKYLDCECARREEKNLDEDFKKKVYELINKLNEKDFEEVEYEPLVGSGPIIHSKSFTFEITGEYILIVKNKDIKRQFKAKNQNLVLEELYDLLSDKLNMINDF